MGIFKKKEEKEEEVQEETKFYNCVIPCENCGDKEEYNIPFGTYVIDYLTGKTCEHCGCLLLGEEDLDEDDIEAVKQIIAEEEQANQEEVIENAEEERRDNIPKINVPSF